MEIIPKSLREQIPWYPTIDLDLCINCGVCVEFCKNKVYAFDDIITSVVNPYNCVILCTGCKDKCEVGAISFPNKDDILILVRKAKLLIKTCGCGDGCNDDCDCKI